MSSVIDGATARHYIANLLHTYTDIADRKDVDAVVDLLGDAVVAFPSDGYDNRQDAAAFFGRLWAAPAAHRHDVSNLVVAGQHDETWTATAHYTRYVLDPDPVLATLGEYALTVRPEGDRWSVERLTVTRTWAR